MSHGLQPESDDFARNFFPRSFPRSSISWTMPPKRAASEETQAETQAVVKRYRQAIDEVARSMCAPSLPSFLSTR